MKRLLKKAVQALAELIFELSVTMFVTIPAKDTLVEAAYNERGYNAIGGEWLAIILIAGAVFYLTRHCVNWILRGGADDDRNKGARREVPGRTNTADIVRGRAGKSSSKAEKNYQPRG